MSNNYFNSDNTKDYSLPPKFYEKKQYEISLNELLEKIRSAALGNDYQSRLELKKLEKKVIIKLMDTEREIIEIVKAARADQLNSNQGKLF